MENLVFSTHTVLLTLQLLSPEKKTNSGGPKSLRETQPVHSAQWSPDTHLTPKPGVSTTRNKPLILSCHSSNEPLCLIDDTLKAAHRQRKATQALRMGWECTKGPDRNLVLKTLRGRQGQNYCHLVPALFAGWPEGKARHKDPVQCRQPEGVTAGQGAGRQSRNESSRDDLAMSREDVSKNMKWLLANTLK